MGRQHVYFPYALIGIGFYFFIIQFDHPLIQKLNTWPIVLIAFGLFGLLKFMQKKKPSLFFEGLLILLIGIHFYGLKHISHWPDDSSVFLFIWGVCLLLLFMMTKKHLMLSLILIAVSLIFFFSDHLPTWLPSFNHIQAEINAHWPLVVIGLGVLLLFYKK